VNRPCSRPVSSSLGCAFWRRNRGRAVVGAQVGRAQRGRGVEIASRQCVQTFQGDKKTKTGGAVRADLVNLPAARLMRASRNRPGCANHRLPRVLTRTRASARARAWVGRAALAAACLPAVYHQLGYGGLAASNADERANEDSATHESYCHLTMCRPSSNHEKPDWAKAPFVNVLCGADSTERSVLVRFSGPL
jgi:hypothetical protein